MKTGPCRTASGFKDHSAVIDGRIVCMSRLPNAINVLARTRDGLAALATMRDENLTFDELYADLSKGDGVILPTKEQFRKYIDLALIAMFDTDFLADCLHQNMGINETLDMYRAYRAIRSVTSQKDVTA